MKIDAHTITVLKNFAKINPSIVIMAGNTLKTISISRTIIAKASVPTVFDRKFAIYNLDRFIATLSLFNDPDLTFEENFVTISDGNKKVNYMYTTEESVVRPLEKNITIKNPEVSVKLPYEVYKDVERALNILSMPEIHFVGDGQNIYIQAADSRNPSGDVYSAKLGATDNTFKVIFKQEYIKILPSDYDIRISSSGISHFSGEHSEYWIGVESKSVFN